MDNTSIKKREVDLWEFADLLRAGSKPYIESVLQKLIQVRLETMKWIIT